jgi:nucleotide-binding universal stress UspA family protein
LAVIRRETTIRRVLWRFGGEAVVAFARHRTTYTRGRDLSSDPIVVGTDGSARAERAVDRAGELAKALGAPLHIVAVRETAETAAAVVQEALAGSRHRLEARGVKVQTHLLAGSAAAELMTIAEAKHAQMIVVGNRGMTGARRIPGSVPNDVSHNAQCAVLIVPRPQGTSRPDGRSRSSSVVKQRREVRLIGAPFRRRVQNVPDRPDGVDVARLHRIVPGRVHEL